MSGLRPDMTIYQRVEVIEEALAKVLNRDSTMSVEQTGPAYRDRGVWVIEDHHSERRVAHDLYQLALEMERLL
jgi:hypothetical protein